jgi:predicted nuclease of restriction endonuclease-like (RecB) superfamily
MTGLSRTNLLYMRAFAAAWPEPAIVQRLVGRLRWGHDIELLDKLDTAAVREWYARNAIEHGWSRTELANQIMSQLHQRAGAAPSNFADVLPAGDSELMQQLTKDPYNLKFLTLTAPVAERHLERALVAQVERFLLELGTGFAFVGRQWRLELAGDEFFIDLLMFHIPTSRYLVLELKSKKLTPADVGQLNFYVAAVDGEVRLEHHAPPVGLLLCATRNERTVRYALARSTSPMAVAGYRYKKLPPAEQAAFPAEAELVDAVRGLSDRVCNRA